MDHIGDILRRAKVPRKREDLEQIFANDLIKRRLPTPERQVRFAAELLGRQWRFDFSWRPYMVAVEIDGLVVRRIGGELICMGRHASVEGIRGDFDKGNAAIMLGWSVLHFERSHVKSGEACDVLIRVLSTRGWSQQ